ncbi:triose-phosphate isomerase [Streptomyces yunnanensis]|uniref:Triosephosphate isomerase n=1 Tax=Streptomyces yunnanensis TaxID=156453 RepID=A0A9X8QZ94_9ACTN|nr:triose-phosphate isomerase family protein [Streptomyces yunnanensis]SHN21102.1 triosephosphate isomerase [Streptomyces yunnanensis]
MSDVIPEAVPLHHATAPAARAAPRPVVGVSLKLYFGLARTRAWLAEVAALDAVLAGLPRPVDLFVLPSFPALADARELLSGTRIGYGAQDVHWAEQGAWTGEVSAGMLVETGARYVEVGHAERRRHFGETDETVAAKTRAATTAGLVPVICAGEQRAGDPATAAEETLAQVRAALAGAAPGSEVIVAYEPVWAIGAREPAPAGHVRAVATALRGALHDHNVRGRLIYGGTAGPGTHGELAGAVDGLFLGRLAHDTEGLRKVLEELSGG